MKGTAILNSLFYRRENVYFTGGKMCILQEGKCVFYRMENVYFTGGKMCILQEGKCVFYHSNLHTYVNSGFNIF